MAPADDTLVMRICEAIVALSEGMRRAMHADDIAAFTELVEQRGDLITQCLARWETLNGAHRQEIAPLLQTALDLDAATLMDAEAWLRQARQQLSQLGQGAMTLRSYQAPLTPIAMVRGIKLNG